jgi:hypothetical protein
MGSGGQGTGGSDCACTEGPCCDGCDFRPPEFQCADDEIRNQTCSLIDAEWCPGFLGKTTISRDFYDVWCSGASAECDGAEELDFSGGGFPCDGNDVCEGDPGEAQCVPCES